MARKYKNMKGTNDFLVASIGLFLLCLWAVRDGWFPTQSILERHPQTSQTIFESPGRVEEILREVGSTVSSNTPVVRMSTRELEDRQSQYEERLEELGREIRRSEANLIGVDVEEEREAIRSRVAEKELALRELRRQIAGVRQDIMRNMLRPEYSGTVSDIMVSPGDQVEEGEPAFSIDVKGYFYTFNKSLALVSLIGSIICAIMHVKLR